MGSAGIRRGCWVALLLCAAVGVAGCSGDRDTGEGRRVEATVKRFSLARGREACNLMTHGELIRVYGRSTATPRAARAACLAASRRFTGQPIDVTFVRITKTNAAHLTARTLDGKRYFSVTLSKRRGRWLIDSVMPIPRPG